MRTTEAIRGGLSGAGRAKWMVFIFFGCNLLLAAAVAAPMHSAISEHVGHSMYGQQLARDFSADWLFEFQMANGNFLQGFSSAIVYAGILFLALNTLLAGGAFEVFKRGEAARMQVFGSGMGKNFFRFARIAILASFAYFVAFWFWNGPVLDGLDRLFRNSVVERWHFYLNWVRVALLLASVLVINAVVEFARAGVVVDEHSSVLAALGQAAGFVIANFRRVLAIYLSLGCLVLAAIVAYGAFARYFPQRSVLTVLIWFVVAQVLLWLRWMLRLSLWGAVVAYYQANAANHELAASMEAGAQA